MLPPKESIYISEQKQLRIGEVADLFSIERHVLRYWEKEFAELDPRKTSTNQRSYTREDLEIIWIIKYLLYVQNFTMIGASAKLSEIVSHNLSIDDVEQHFQSLFVKEEPDHSQILSHLHSELERLTQVKIHLEKQLEKHSEEQEQMMQLASQTLNLRAEVDRLLIENHQLKEDNNALSDSVSHLQNAIHQNSHSSEHFDLTMHSLQNLRSELHSLLGWAQSYPS